jgi:hypothetical protein
MPSERKLWLLRDSGEIYALCSLCVMHRRLEFYVDHHASDGEIAEVVALQGGRCRAEIEDFPSCLTSPPASVETAPSDAGETTSTLTCSEAAIGRSRVGGPQ